MASKNITLTDVTMETIYLFPLADGLLPLKGNYTIVSTDIDLFSGRVFVTERNPLWATLPQNIKDALILINAYMKTAAMEDRGMA